MTDAEFAAAIEQEQAWLAQVPAADVLANAHRIYEFMAEGGIPAESVVREQAFSQASLALGLDYDVFYLAWLNQVPATASKGA